MRFWDERGSTGECGGTPAPTLPRGNTGRPRHVGPIVELVGREGELRAACAALDDVRDGHVRVLVLLGEAGIGKSALLGAIAARARARTRPPLVLAGRAAEHERDVPFAVAVDALDTHVAGLHPSRLGALGPDLGRVLPAAAGHDAAVETAAGDPAGRVRHHRALASLLEMLGRERPFVLLLDDLHWADDASLELVLHLLRRPPPVAHLLAVALRPAARMSRLLDAACRAPGFEQLSLGPLGGAAAQDLLSGVGDPVVRERLAHEARGNPLYLRELARAAAGQGDSLPATLTAVIGSELAELGPAARRLADGAAVAGDPFDLELASAAAGVEPDGAGLDELVAAGLCAPAGTAGREFAFRHPLVQRAVYDVAPPAWRLAAHERAATALERRRADPARRAHHMARFARPGDERAIALLAEAAASAAPATSARYYAAALDLVPAADRGRRADLLAPLARSLAATGGSPTAAPR